MSHDRGCHCGKERWEYHECRNRECVRGPVYDAAYHQQQVEKRLGKFRQHRMSCAVMPLSFWREDPLELPREPLDYVAKGFD